MTTKNQARGCPHHGMKHVARASSETAPSALGDVRVAYVYCNAFKGGFGRGYCGHYIDRYSFSRKDYDALPVVTHA